MTELHVITGERRYTFLPGVTARIGRNTSNDVVVSDPTVSRQHAQLSFDGNIWVWQNTGGAATFVGGQPVGQFAVSQPAIVSLASPQGPVVRLEPAVAPVQPIPTQVAGPAVALGAELGTPATNVAGRHPDAARPVLFGGSPQPGNAAGLAPEAPPAGAPSPQQAPAAPYPQQAPGVPYPQQAGGAPYPQQAPGAPYPQQAPGRPPYPPQQGAGWAPGQQQPGAQPPPGQYGLPPGAVAVAGQPRRPQQDTPGALQILIPVKSWLTDRGWRQGLRLLVIPYALLPLIFIALFANSVSLQTSGWAYSLYIAPLWLLVFWYLIRPGKITVREVVMAFCMVVWILIWMQLVTININQQLVKGGFTFPAAIGVGYNEEITKALPVLLTAMLLLKIRKTKLDPRMWMFFGTIMGLTFGVVEQAAYTVQDIIAVHNGAAVVGVLAFSERVFVDGLQHAVWAGISCFFVGMAVNYRRRRFLLLILGISIPAILHGLNDWSGGALHSLWPPILVQTFSLLLFLGYTLSAAAIERQVRRSPTFRGDSILMEAFSLPGETPAS